MDSYLAISAIYSFVKSSEIGAQGPS